MNKKCVLFRQEEKLSSKLAAGTDAITITSDVKFAA